ncbi:MAG: hypothetical protein ABJB65_03790 [Chloroflexota bacterium]
MDEQDRDQQPDNDTEGHAIRRNVVPDEDDVEGHNLSMNPTIADQLARSRDADVQRAARGGFFRRDAKENQRRGR